MELVKWKGYQLSGIGGNKLLAVPAIRHNSSSFAGSLIADASNELIKIWDCKNSLAEMVFDKTCSNTEAQTAVCIALQDTVQFQAVTLIRMPSSCGHVWVVFKIQVSKSPKIQIFQRIRNHFFYY